MHEEIQGGAKMRQSNYKPKMPDLMEAVFDAAYLLFDLTAGILFFVFSKHRCTRGTNEIK